MEFISFFFILLKYFFPKYSMWLDFSGKWLSLVFNCHSDISPSLLFILSANRLNSPHFSCDENKSVWRLFFLIKFLLDKKIFSTGESIGS